MINSDRHETNIDPKDTTMSEEVKAITAKEALKALAMLVPALDEMKDAEATAKEDCDDDLVETIKASRVTLLDSVNELFVAIMGQPLHERSALRRAGLCRFAAAGHKVAEIRKYGDAVRIGSVEGITLPAGRYGNLSRGKSWCRKGSGANAVWANNDGGHRVAEAGKWIVGSSDGFARKEQTQWDVFVACGIYCAD